MHLRTVGRLCGGGRVVHRDRGGPEDHALAPGRPHPDRLGPLIELSRCCFQKGRIERAISACDEAIDGVDFISNKPHRLAVGLRRAQAEMREVPDGGRSATLSSHSSCSTFPMIDV